MSRLVTALTLSLLTVASLGAQDIVLPDGKAKSIVQNSCADCHGLDQVVNNPMSREEWRTTVNQMVKRGANLSPAEIDTVVDYLAVFFVPDKINVNTSSAKEIQSALALTEAQSNAVVDYRTKNGKIADLATLAKAAGVDAKKLDPKKELIAF